MTRRKMFAAIFALPAVACLPETRAKETNHDEFALAGVTPVCPRCGLLVWFERSRFEPGPLNRPVSVRCDCGWHGLAPRAMEMTRAHHG